jgi:branched-chain amino acid transport system ATP-binding protein
VFVLPSAPSLEVDAIVAGYGDAAIVRGVSLQATSGQIAVIVGPNGAGKSTLMKAIVGLITPMSGAVRLGAEDITSLAPSERVRRGLGYVPQVDNVFPSLSVFENLEMGSYFVRGKVGDRVEELLELFPDLKPALRRPARTLSGGQRNMLALARGLMPRPNVLLVDEPTAGLSPRYEGAVWDHLIAIRDTGVGVIAVEQNTRRALSNADDAYLLVLGECRRRGSGQQLLADEELVSLYIGRAVEA